MTQITQVHQMSHACSVNRSSNGNRSRPQRNAKRCPVNGATSRNGQSQRGKQVTYPWINGQIITAAETGDMQHFLFTINQHLEHMNLVNMSTGLHRLAKLAGNQARHQAQLQQTLAALLEAVRQALIRSEETGATPKCQALSNITWALATLQVVDIPLLSMIIPRAYSQITNFKNFELCQLLWAFAKLGSVNSALCDSSAPLFAPSAQLVMRHIDEFSFRALVMTSWSFATAKQQDNRMFHAIAMKLLPSLHEANSQEMANAAWAFSTAGVFEEDLFELLAHVAIPRMLEFKPQELSSILWSFASIGYCNDDFFEAAGRAAMQLQLQAQQLANILWALAKMRPRHDSTRQVLLQLLPQCTMLIRTFKTQELASVALAASRCFGSLPGSEGNTDLMQPAPIQVQGFFHAALPMTLPKLQEHSGQSLANIASSFLAVQVSGIDTSGLFAGVSYEVMRRAESLENSALLLLLKTLPHVPQSAPVDDAVRRLLRDAARRVDSLSSREVQAISRVCGRLNGRNKDADNAQQTASKESREELQTYLLTLASMWCSFHQTQQPEAAQAATLGEATEENPNDALDRWAPAFTLTCANTGRPASAWDEKAMQDLREAMEDTAAKREEMVGHMSPSADQAAQQQQKTEFVFCVKNTFLDVEDSSDGEGSESEIMQMPLPPALSFIPDSVSAEKLHAYRANYARFRVGNAIGAKGEVVTVS